MTNVSGRGVGMDVVKSNIEKIGGVVDVCQPAGRRRHRQAQDPAHSGHHSRPGDHAAAANEFVIPQVSLLELIRLEGDSGEKHIERVHGTPVYRRRGSLLPIAYLNQVLGLKSAEQAEAVSMVVLQAEDRQFGLVVDGINDTQEIVVKPLGKQLKGLTVYAGATIMGDGRVALILDVLGIGQRSGVLAEFREQARAASGTEDAVRDRAAAAAAVPGRFLRAPGGSALSGGQAGGVSAVGHRACRRRPGGAIPEPHPAAGASAARARTRRAGHEQTRRSGAGDCFQRRRPQRGHGGRPDSGCRRRGGHGAPEDRAARACSARRWWASGSRISSISTR